MSDTTTAVATRADAPDPSPLYRALAENNLAGLTEEQRIGYLRQICLDMGLNPLTMPISFYATKDRAGRVTLKPYVRKDGTEQFRKLYSVSIQITDRHLGPDDVYTVTARATLPSGRHDEDTGAVSLKGLDPDSRANAVKKAITQAKRRVTLSIIGLGFLDESEIEDVAGAVTVQAPTPAQQQLPPPAPAANGQAPARSTKLAMTSDQMAEISGLVDGMKLPADKFAMRLREKYGVADWHQLNAEQAVDLIHALKMAGQARREKAAAAAPKS